MKLGGFLLPHGVACRGSWYAPDQAVSVFPMVFWKPLEIQGVDPFSAVQSGSEQYSYLVNAMI
jgi:hypothetical protein